MDLAAALAVARDTRRGVLVTHRRDGRAQLSNIAFVVTEGDVIHISITADRAKTKNLARDPRCELYLGREDFGGYAVLDATCALMPVAADPNDATVDALVAYYAALRGDHPDWEEYRRAMVNDRRLIAQLTVERAYGMWPN